ncbi:hypothetical protein RFI_08164 [Reticulomyxa filosa]|uniref:Uncharacterized protein n=1 Tax=Reticulomyxa filosa TaxID=46433 RepID=X6NSQ7_RETFI|nr:hypothetical protein RFI_08164 [Reticulomyxa filosa]|eukprot:ETO28963.1 hypothetical protein RFI_08164 [Reticulomyxa filosa]
MKFFMTVFKNNKRLFIKQTNVDAQWKHCLNSFFKLKSFFLIQFITNDRKEVVRAIGHDSSSKKIPKSIRIKQQKSMSFTVQIQYKLPNADIGAKYATSKQRGKAKPSLIQNKGKKQQKKAQKKEANQIETCAMMFEQLQLDGIRDPKLRNGIDFLLLTENERQVKLENNKWHCFKFGVFLLGHGISLTVQNDADDVNDMGHLKLKTSYLWIQNTCVIHCNSLGYPSDMGPGKGEKGTEIRRAGGGASYGSKGRTRNFVSGNGKNGVPYGEDSLLKEIHFGSGGGSTFVCKKSHWEGGRGGGIIEIIVEQQLISEGAIECNASGGGWIDIDAGGGSGGSILLVLQAPCHIPHLLGHIVAAGGGTFNRGIYTGGHGRIAIYSRAIALLAMHTVFPPPYTSKAIPKESFLLSK